MPPPTTASRTAVVAAGSGADERNGPPETAAAPCGECDGLEAAAATAAADPVAASTVAGLSKYELLASNQAMLVPLGLQAVKLPTEKREKKLSTSTLTPEAEETETDETEAEETETEAEEVEEAEAEEIEVHMALQELEQQRKRILEFHVSKLDETHLYDWIIAANEAQKRWKQPNPNQAAKRAKQKDGTSFQAIGPTASVPSYAVIGTRVMCTLCSGVFVLKNNGKMRQHACVKRSGNPSRSV